MIPVTLNPSPLVIAKFIATRFDLYELDVLCTVSRRAPGHEIRPAKVSLPIVFGQVAQDLLNAPGPKNAQNGPPALLIFICVGPQILAQRTRWVLPILVGPQQFSSVIRQHIQMILEGLMTSTGVSRAAEIMR